MTTDWTAPIAHAFHDLGYDPAVTTWQAAIDSHEEQQP